MLCNVIEREYLSNLFPSLFTKELPWVIRSGCSWQKSDTAIGSFSRANLYFTLLLTKTSKSLEKPMIEFPTLGHGVGLTLDYHKNNMSGTVQDLHYFPMSDNIAKLNPQNQVLIKRWHGLLNLFYSKSALLIGISFLVEIICANHSESKLLSLPLKSC